MKTGKAVRRQARDRKALGVAAGALVGLLLLSGALLWIMAPPRQGAVGEAAIGGPFSLVDDEGKVITDRSFPGRYLAIYFGYTKCPDICPATLNTLTAALNRMGAKSSLVQPLFITLDPARDTQPVLHRYVGAFSPRLIGLRGDAAVLHRVSDAFRVVSLVHEEAGHAPDYTLDHSAVIYLMAPDGHFVAPIPADASEMTMAQAMARNIRPVS